MGPPIRNSDGWQKVWRDFKCKVKRKLVHNKTEVNATGGGTYNQLILSPLEEAAANLLQFQQQLNPKGVVQGIQSSLDEIVTEDMSNVELTILEDMENMPSTSANALQILEEPTSNKRKRREIRNNDGKTELFQKHNDMQSKVFTEISNTLTEIKNVLKGNEATMIEIKNVLKETRRYNRKLWEVEEKKMKMQERQNQREEQLFQAEMELKKIKKEIKIKELEVLEKQCMS